MSELAVYALTWVKARAAESRRDDGALSVEQVVLTVCVLAAALLVAAAITAAVQGRIGNIT
ncbi:hypothetical protein ACWT_5759 [Actinoplanes sp. SE50]|uniref:hypothetical protein n=1 Tax=unclassified Actinoplanes TaxID=2626549 RepID=UPI00023ED674|nr:MULTISPECIES: hypothetical protein [unclassified Actinoplanes]AEV86777.1 hypothetical protein ACPL_5890 [Actinoplanes sp. SE50/110]ATO85174.1 hypothetical protein ACWT_5759 [Actinoplanes sp. SE50]SLM02584.1 hypothetical protein ACSP50_5866 [Actinoplanes sp. SE50/110]